MLKLSSKENIWICSDPHYHHKNMCRGVSSWSKESHTRDFNNLDEMNNILVKNINNNVKSEDYLFCLGDWSFGGIDKIKEFRDKINCKRINLILGNHDKYIYGKSDEFISVNNYLEVEIDDSKFVLSHYPMASWNGLRKGWMHLFGHCHLLPSQKLREGKSMDVGFDGHIEFRPYHITEVISILKDQPISGITIPKEIDHHQI